MLFFIIVLRIFLGPIANVYQKKISNKGANSVFVVFVTYFIISVILFPFLFFINYQNLGIIFWKLIIITSLLDAAGNIFLVKALQTTDLSIFGPINSLKPAVTMIFAIFFINEIPTLNGIIGLIIILLGTIFLTYEKTTKFTLSKGILFRVIGIILSATASIYMKKSITYSSVEITLIFWAVISTPLMFLILILNFKKTKSNLYILKNNISDYTKLTIIYLIMPYVTLLCFKHTLVSYSLALFQLSSIITLFFGYKYFNEKNIKKKIICSTFMIIGALLILI